MEATAVTGLSAGKLSGGRQRLGALERERSLDDGRGGDCRFSGLRSRDFRRGRRVSRGYHGAYVSVGSIFERSQESGTSVDVAGGTEASAAWDSGLLDESGVLVHVVAMIGASAAWKFDPSRKSDANSGVAGLVGVVLEFLFYSSEMVVHLLI